ncbi:hypothetical protein JAO73_09095 [Hymenobacter sp. BT523]|uniref:hypothetical protein n=1 Tax=Hymenobacter sp. BT523 TaxID=2795725 RepID=UPI0018EADD0E|nr:hypothetical protein [Hymenobacter sp. BT523]MBJ6109165.1 hypothetical protein [Hymenobacter sp. BT523]
MAICSLSTILLWLKGTTTDDGAPADYVLNFRHYGAFAAVTATLASYFLARRYFKYFFALTFLLGVVGLINFTISEIKVGLTLGPLQIGLSPILVAVGIVTYLLYSNRINAKLLALLQPSEEKVAKVQEEEIEEFKEKFARKSTEELTQIVAANALLPNALLAAKQLLKERP